MSEVDNLIEFDLSLGGHDGVSLTLKKREHKATIVIRVDEEGFLTVSANRGKAKLNWPGIFI